MLKPGTQIAGYMIEGSLGHGGMGIVYEARQMSLNRVVALKILSPELSTDVSFRERFRREGEIQAAIDHPHIVTVYEAGEIDEGLFIAMRLVRGPTLKDMIIARELEAARTLRILSPVADALDAAHGAGLIHRDIKPQNILVGPRDHAYLADFGLTKGANESGLTRTGQFVGTIDYISPEQIRGEPARPASDIYAFAAVLYECLTGIVPYAKPSDAAVLFAHMSDPAPLVTEQRPELPPALNDVILRGMSKDPDERQPSATALIEDAEQAFGKRIRAVLTPPGPVTTPEELGIRENEAKVPTRQTRVREAAELADAAVAPDAPPADATRQREAPPPADATRQADAPPPADATRQREAPPPADATRQREAPVEEEPVEPGAGDEEAAQAEAATEPLVAPTRAGKTAKTAPAPAPVQPTALRRDRPGAGAPPLIPIAAVVVLVLVVVGFLVGRSGGGGDSGPALASSTSTSDVSLSYPTTWKKGTAPTLTGLSFSGTPIALTRTGSAGTGVVAGFTDATGPTLLPAALLGKLSAQPKADDPVKIGKVSGYRYKDLKPQGSNSALTIFAVPTSVGVATVACYRPSSAAAVKDCERIAGSLALERGKAFALGPSADYGSALSKAVGALSKARTSGRTLLGKAKSARAQSLAAGRLSSAYRTAAQSLSKLTISPADQAANAAIVKALQDTGKAYGKMGTAARGGNTSAYAVASRGVQKGEAAVTKALGDLESLGYSVS